MQARTSQAPKNIQQAESDPFTPVHNNPLFSWPINMGAVFSWYKKAWDIPSELLILLSLALISWAFFSPAILTSEGALSWEAIALMYLRNLLYISIIAGALHIFLYNKRAQSDQDKYEKPFLHRPSNRFSFGNQLYDNIFWTIASGVTLWTAYEVLVFFWYATHPSLYLSFSDAPIWFVVLFPLLVIFESAHFYFVHRLLHVPVFYRLFHALHHRNVNPGPWSGISMHPGEHVIYFSSILIHLVIPSHPVHIFFHMYIMSLSPVAGHCGFENLIIGNKRRLALGHFHHQLHHRHFDCNYGSSELPWDVWFGSFHDGTPEAHKMLKKKRK